MKSLPLAALLLGGIIGGALGASALSAGPMPKLPDVLEGVIPAGWGGGHHHGAKGRHGGPGTMGGMPLMRLAREADTDKDMALTQQEVDAYVAGKVQLGDQSGDGNLTIDEFQTVWLSIMRPQMVDRFQELDEDGDGAITEVELTERFGGIVEDLDRNGDGKIDRSDFRHGPRGRRGERHGDRDEERRAERRAEREDPAEQAPAPAPTPAPAPAAPAPDLPAPAN